MSKHRSNTDAISFAIRAISLLVMGLATIQTRLIRIQGRRLK